MDSPIAAKQELHSIIDIGRGCVLPPRTGAEGDLMARYGTAASKSVKSALHREKKGKLRSGKGGKGGKVTSRKQAIAIGLSEARKKGAKVPRKKS
jgi:hypothetical protein